MLHWLAYRMIIRTASVAPWRRRKASANCAGYALTALRLRVLELVWESHKPLGAYDILAILS